MAISRDKLNNMIQKWRNGSSEANSKSSKLQDAYLEYLDSILEKEGYDTFATDPDTGKELDEYTPEFETTQAEVMKDLGLGDDDMELIFNGEGDFNDFETEYDDKGLPIKSSDKSYDKTPDDPDELSDKPHDEGLAGETTPEEDFMQRAAEGKIPATSGVLAGDLTPEEIEMIRMMRAKKQPKKNAGLAGETTPEEDEMLKLVSNQTLSDERFKNITNRLAKTLSKHRW